jgi:large subunit ribosomal protein L5
MADEKKPVDKAKLQAAGAAKKSKGPAKIEGGEQTPPKLLRLKDKYEKEVVPALMTKFKITNKFAVPRVTKVCLNMGFGKAAADNNPKVGEACLADMTAISGQRAVVTAAKKSVSNFKLREGMQIGCRVTLRGPKMYEFLDRFFNIALPRVRDFRGISPRSFDGRGNYSVGVQEQTVFPEIEADKAEVHHGMDVTICTTAKKDEHARELLRAMGCPFREI